MGSIHSKRAPEAFPTTVLPIPAVRNVQARESGQGLTRNKQGGPQLTPCAAEKESTGKIRRLAQCEKVRGEFNGTVIRKRGDSCGCGRKGELSEVGLCGVLGLLGDI